MSMNPFSGITFAGDAAVPYVDFPGAVKEAVSTLSPETVQKAAAVATVAVPVAVLAGRVAIVVGGATTGLAGLFAASVFAGITTAISGK